jgi:hypothetical protein
MILRQRNKIGVLRHRLRAGFFWRDADPGGREREPGVGAGGRPRWALPLGRTGCLGCGGCSLRRLWGGRGPGRSGRGLERPVEPRGFRLSDLWRLRPLWRRGPAGGFRWRVGWFGGVFRLPVGPVLDRLGDPRDRFQDREEEVLDRVFRLLGGFAPKQPPGQPPPEALAEQADQLGDDGERGGRRHGGYVAQRARRVK